MLWQGEYEGPDRRGSRIRVREADVVSEAESTTP